MEFDLQVLVPVAVVGVFTLIAATTDVWKLKVYNVITVPLLVGGIVYHAAVAYWLDQQVVEGVRASLAGLACGFILLVVPYMMGGMGSADVKLISAIGAWLGLELTLVVFLASCLAAGVASVFKILYYGTGRETWQNLHVMWYRVVAFWRFLSAEENIEQVLDSQRRRRAIPFGAMLAFGVLATALWLGWSDLRP